MAFRDLDLPNDGDTSEQVAQRVAAARTIQTERFTSHDGIRVNADAHGQTLEEIATPDAEGRALLSQVAERFGLTARGYHRVLRVARTIADLGGADQIRRPHLAGAISFRLTTSQEI